MTAMTYGSAPASLRPDRVAQARRNAYLDRVTSHTDPVRTERGIAYGHGQALDIYLPPGTAGSPAVLLWHGVGVSERDLMEPLSRTAAALGVTVFVPDWDSGAADGGRAQLLASLSFT